MTILNNLGTFAQLRLFRKYKCALWLFNKYVEFVSFPRLSLFIIKLPSHWLSDRHDDAFHSVIGWIPGSKLTPLLTLTSTSAGKMASLTGAVQTNRPGSVSPSKKRTAAMTQRGLRMSVHSVLFVLSLASVLQCAVADGKTLVLLDNFNIRDTHSMFFRSLAGAYTTKASFKSIPLLL